MNDLGIPFNPLREGLYTPEELFGGFDPADDSSYARCADLAILSYFWSHGVNPTRKSEAATLEALHDNAMSTAIRRFTDQHPDVIAIMGGHGMRRGAPAYAGIAHIAHRLASDGFLLASGGGPGAMEATHLGALFSRRPVAELDDAIATLGKAEPLPKDLDKLVKQDGTIDPGVARLLHAWFAPAFAIRQALVRENRGLSLGIPTWLYGFEPTTLFATHIGKYFQNSIREDGLVTIGVRGIVFAEGSAGTVQEIFQDAAQNYYKSFYPMVFLSSPAPEGQHFWEKALPVRPLVEALLAPKEGFKKVLFTDSNDAVVTFLKTHRRS
jgi:predicted Rossmann-fold nucleotide-binding protein